MKRFVIISTTIFHNKGNMTCSDNSLQSQKFEEKIPNRSKSKTNQRQIKCHGEVSILF